MRAGDDPGRIIFRGPVITVGLSHPLDMQQAPPAQVQVTLVPALLDTGAGSNMINPGLTPQLNLPIVGFTRFSSASHQDILARQYVVALWMQPPLVKSFNYVPLLEAPQDMQHHQLIMSRQVMANWLLTFDSARGSYTIRD